MSDVKTTKKVVATAPKSAGITYLHFGQVMMKMPLPELHTSSVPELPPPVGMAYPFTQEKNPLHYTALSFTV